MFTQSCNRCQKLIGNSAMGACQCTAPAWGGGWTYSTNTVKVGDHYAQRPVYYPGFQSGQYYVSKCVDCKSLPCICATGFTYNIDSCPDCLKKPDSCECKDGVVCCGYCGTPNFSNEPGVVCGCLAIRSGYPDDKESFEAYCNAIRSRRALSHDLNKLTFSWCLCPGCVERKSEQNAALNTQPVGEAVHVTPEMMKNIHQILSKHFDEGTRMLKERELSCPTCRRVFCKVMAQEDTKIEVICEGCRSEGR